MKARIVKTQGHSFPLGSIVDVVDYDPTNRFWLAYDKKGLSQYLISINFVSAVNIHRNTAII